MIFNNLNDYFVILLTIVVTLNGIAIPLSYNIIAENLKSYFDKHVANIFLKEEAFQSNVIVSLWSLPILSFPLIVDITKLFNVENNNSISTGFMNFYVLFSFFFMAGFLMSFIRFSKMIYNYASNTEEIVYEKLKKEIDEYLHV